MSKFLDTFLVLLLFLSPIGVLIFYEDSIENADMLGLIVVAILLIVFFGLIVRHTSLAANHPKKAMKELEENQEKSRRV